jgi:hypothetical protein
MRIPFLALVLAGCADREDTGACCQWPDVEGPLWIELGTEAVLETVGADCDVPFSYTWAFEALPEASALDDAVFGPTNATEEAATIRFTPDAVGFYVIRLAVSDTRELRTSDLGVVGVSDPES